MYVVYDNTVNRNTVRATNDSIDHPAVNLADARTTRYFRATANTSTIHISTDRDADTIVIYKSNLSIAATISIQMLGFTFEIDMSKTYGEGEHYYYYVYSDLILFKVFGISMFDLLLDAPDLQKDYTWWDEGTPNERIKEIVYSSESMQVSFIENYLYQYYANQFRLYRTSRRLVASESFEGLEVDITITDLTREFIQILCLYFGTYLKFNHPKQSQKFSYEVVDNLGESVGGHSYGEVQFKRKLADIDLPAMTIAETADLVAFWLATASTKTVFLIVWDNSTDFYEPLYCRLDTKKLKINNEGKMFLPFSSSLPFVEAF